MFLSKNKNTHGRYYVYYKGDNGKRKAVSTRTSFKKEALAFLIEFGNSIKEINSQIPSPKPLKSFSELEEKVMFYVTNNLRNGSVNIYKNTFKNFTEIIGVKPLNEITNKDIEYYKSCRLKVVTPSTVNIDLSVPFQNLMDQKGWFIKR